ncbi:family 78 glycoside hydrolase catalytic domain [Pediococcus cellicola]|uniref:Alpha-L-rhamnosidase n=1 Tax=Pediococcus cellicola TaxID=319652 RepID=A0A0R2IZG9_9LACO|nr:family 78 glycoside hydrolase catalytic domain [Pediococcus cellicola]KRN67252.1 alpha-L-rhamnosidase [Pediococcus cellicola]GEL14894.1 alpha-L-rhamnosidase [Pediococcus cellicola]
MGFTFQKHADIKYLHNQSLLAKARQYQPKINHHRVKALAVVNLCQNADALNGVGVTKVKDIDELASQPLKRGDKLILDFGDHYVGQFRIHIKAVGSPMDAPLSLQLRFAEMPAELMSDNSEYQGWLSKSWIQETHEHLDVLPATLELPRRYSFRYVELTVVDTSPKWQAIFEHPVVDAQSSADIAKVRPPKLGDPELQAIYQVGLKTLEDCMQDVFEDGPKRDRRLWLGDLRLQALANYTTFKNTDLVKRCLYLFGAMPSEDGRVPADVFTKPSEVPDDTFLFDYSLFFISVLADYEDFTANKQVLTDLYNVAKRQIDVALQQVSKQGELKLTADYPVFVDWSDTFDKTTSGQAILIYVLKQFLVLARQIKDPEIQVYAEKLTSLEKFAKQHLFDRRVGLFMSGSQHEYNVASQVWMTLAHVFSDQENHQLMQLTVNKFFPIQGIATPYLYHHVTQALFEAGLQEEAVKLMKAYWGKMIRLGADTYWEAFDPEKPNYSPYGSLALNSYCHAWSCTPVYLIDKYLK